MGNAASIDWSVAQAELERLASEGRSGRQIGAALGVSRNAVLGRAHRTGVRLHGEGPKRERKPRPPRQPRVAGPRKDRIDSPEWAAAKELARRLYAEGKTYQEIADLSGVNQGTITSLVRDLPRRRLTSANHKRRDRSYRLTALAAHFSGKSQAAVAAAMGFYPLSLRNWMRDAALVCEARGIAARIVAEQRRSREAEWSRRKAAEDARLASLRAHNDPILARLKAKYREVAERRFEGETLQQIGDIFGITRERVRQMEVVCRWYGVRFRDDRPLTDSELRLVSKMHIGGAPRAQRKDRPRKDVFAAAHRVLEIEEGRAFCRKPMTLSDEERERRREWGRKLAAMRHEARA